MNEFIVYGNPASPFLRAVRMALEEKGLPHRIERIGEWRGEAHRKRRGSRWALRRDASFDPP